MQLLKEKIKNHIFSKEGKLIQQRIMPHIFKIRFPNFYEQIKDDFNINLYMFLNDITKKPICENCGKPVKFKNFKEGFRRYCSNKCVNESNSKSKEFSKKISESMKKKFNISFYENKYGFPIKKKGENFLILNYCKHGNLTINKNLFKRKVEANLKTLCPLCANENFKNLKNDFEKTKHWLLENYDKIKYSNEHFYKNFHPQIYKDIYDYSKHIKTNDFSERLYLIMNNLKGAPLCKKCNKNKVRFSPSKNKYNECCDDYSCRKSTSLLEKNIYDFIKTIYKGEIIKNKRINNIEFDLYFPEKNFAIEINGLYWHSEDHKTINYHQDKKLKALELGIHLIFIWEDDICFKFDLIKSILSYKLGVVNKIYARNCKIIEVNKNQSVEFFNKNHLQENCVDSIRYGLVYKNEIVSMMTFGRTRMIMKGDKNLESYELLRFASKTGLTIVGGASKLFSHFLKTHNPKKVISYANLDISDGNLYKKLGFIQDSISKPGYWWYKDNLKYHRSNFMKFKLVKQGHDKNLTETEIMHNLGYKKIWNSGNLKFKYIK